MAQAKTTNPPADVASPAGAEVVHLPGCQCKGVDAPSKSPAIMWDERTVIRGGIEMAILHELEKRLRASGRPAMRYRKERWNAEGEHIGPDLAIRSCEVDIVWTLTAKVRDQLDKFGPR